MNPTPDETSVRHTLSGILDPEFGLSIVELGLIYSVDCHDGVVHVTMTLTTPACPASGYLVEGARAALAAMPGVREALVNLVWEPPWSPAMLSESARSALGWNPPR
ncbi:MAG: metal-sulfur cluster assembly factor [Opitutaceae bacterium]|nr:metal-sulfur cluster assembly factor [Opitutaceae bacterium]